MVETAATPEQDYFAECPDSGVRMSARLTGRVLPPRFVFGCIGDGCSIGEHVLSPISQWEAEQLMADGDELGPDAARWFPRRQCG